MNIKTTIMFASFFYMVSFANAIAIEEKNQAINKRATTNCAALNDAGLLMAGVKNYQPMLVINFDGEGITTTSVDKGVAFRNAKYPRAQKSAWFVPTNGVLVFQETIQITWSKDVGDKNPMIVPKSILTSFDELKKYDDNYDGVIDKKDRNFQKLFIWLNKNSDGRMIEHELHSLADLGISQISLQYECEAVPLLDENSNVYQIKSQVVKKDGSVVWLYHLWLQLNQVKAKRTLSYSDISELTLKAEKGDSDAQYRLGWYYRSGKGVKQDYQTALKWYKLAAAQGNADAQYSIGYMYSYGIGVKQNYAEALKWDLLAAEQEHPKAQYAVGWLYDGGYGMKRRSYLDALKWFKRACDNGNKVACDAYQRKNL